MDETMNFENEEIVEAEPVEMETIETEEFEEDNNSLIKLAAGVAIIGAGVTAAVLFIRKNREKWAKKYLEKNGYEVELVADAERDSDEEVEVEDDSEQE